jgi:hypothetical protein
MSFILALILSLTFFSLVVLNPPSFFNILPYQIHELINPGQGGESIFIKSFDIFLTLFILMVGYLLSRNLFIAFNLFPKRNTIGK